MGAKKYRITETDRARRREQGKLLQAITTKETHSRGGKTRGDLHAIQKTGVCGRSKEQILEDSRKGGLVGGPKAAQNPNSKAALKALTQDRNHQRYASHCSNHVRKGRTKPTCEFCMNPPRAEGKENGN